MKKSGMFKGFSVGEILVKEPLLFLEFWYLISFFARVACVWSSASYRKTFRKHAILRIYIKQIYLPAILKKPSVHFFCLSVVRATAPDVDETISHIVLINILLDYMLLDSHNRLAWPYRWLPPCLLVAKACGS